MKSRDFWLDLLERAVRAFAWATISVLAVGDGVMNAFNADWGEAFGVGLGAAVLSVLGSLASSMVGDGGTASALDTTVTATKYDALARGMGEAGLSGGPK